MKKTKLLFLCLLFLAAVNAQTLSYQAGNAGPGFSNVTTEINGYLSTSQQNVSLEIYSDIYTGVWTGSGDYDYYVNNIFVGSSTTPSLKVDITSYIPVSSVKVVSKAYTWSTVSATVIITPAATLASGPGVSNISYCKAATAVPLQASLTGTGTSLKWFTSAAGEGYSASAPIPSTETVGTKIYYVSQTDNAGVESERSAITITVSDQVVLTCTDDKTVVNPVNQDEVDTEFIAFLNGFGNNSANASAGSFSSNTVGFSGNYAAENWSNTAQSSSSNFNHSVATLIIGANSGGGGTTRQITIPADGIISFDWSAALTGSGGFTFKYIINGTETEIPTGNGAGTIANIAVKTGDVFQFSTWGYTKSSTYTTSISNFEVKTVLPSTFATDNGFVNALAPENWSNTAQSTSSNFNHSAAVLNIGANSGGGGTTRKITIPADGIIGFDWSAAFTGSGGFTFKYIINGTETEIPTGNGAGTIANIAVKAGDVFQFSTWGYTKNSTYTTSITNFSYQYSKANVGAVKGFFANEGSIAVTYTVLSDCGPTSCTKTFSVLKNNTTDNKELMSNELVSYYPNPTRGTVTLNLNKKAGLSIYSLEGKVIRTQQLVEGSNTVHLDDFKAGVYSFRVITNDNVKTFKVIKE